MFKGLEKLKGHIPDTIYQEISKIDAINGPLTGSHFLAQTNYESAGFKKFEENLNYSEEGLLKVFKKYFTPIEAKAYKRQPERIANRVYANRMSNGNEASGDGWRYRGAGAIMLTGRSNYQAFSDWVKDAKVMEGAEYVAKHYPMLSASYFFNTNNLWDIANKGVDDETIKRMTKRVNGGYHGLEGRIKLTKHYYNILIK